MNPVSVPAVFAAFGIFVGAVVPGLAQPVPTRPSAAAPAPDPALEAAERAFMAMDEASRRAVLDALMWTGDYNGVVGVNFGKRGYDGIRAFQKKKNFQQTGILDEAQKTALLAEGKKLRDSVRFAVITEARSGMKIGVPQRVLESSQPIDNGAMKGARYRSNDGAMALDAVAWPVSMQNLDQFLAQGLEPKPNRKVTYKLQRPDFVVMSGEDNGRTFYMRAALHDGIVRGYTFSYPTPRKADFERVMLAVANSFDPFPGTAAANAAPAAQQMAAAQAANAMPQPARPRIAGTGIVTGPGRVLTSAAVLEARCNLTVRGTVAQAGTAEGGFVSLQVAGLNAPQAVLARANPGPQDGAPLIALGIDGQAVALVSGQATGARFTGGLGEGAAGTPVFTANGQLAGVVRDNPKPLAVASIGGPVARSHALIMPPGLGTSAGIPGDMSAGAIAAKFAASIVPVMCGP